MTPELVQAVVQYIMIPVFSAVVIAAFIWMVKD